MKDLQGHIKNDQYSLDEFKKNIYKLAGKEVLEENFKDTFFLELSKISDEKCKMVVFMLSMHVKVQCFEKWMKLDDKKIVICYRYFLNVMNKPPSNMCCGSIEFDEKEKKIMEHNPFFHFFYHQYCYCYFNMDQFMNSCLQNVRRIDVDLWLPISCVMLERITDKNTIEDVIRKTNEVIGELDKTISTLDIAEKINREHNIIKLSHSMILEEKFMIFQYVFFDKCIENNKEEEIMEIASCKFEYKNNKVSFEKDTSKLIRVKSFGEEYDVVELERKNITQTCENRKNFVIYQVLESLIIKETVNLHEEEDDEVDITCFENELEKLWIDDDVETDQSNILALDDPKFKLSYVQDEFEFEMKNSEPEKEESTERMNETKVKSACDHVDSKLLKLISPNNPERNLKKLIEKIKNDDLTLADLRVKLAKLCTKDKLGSLFKDQTIMSFRSLAGEDQQGMFNHLLNLHSQKDSSVMNKPLVCQKIHECYAYFLQESRICMQPIRLTTLEKHLIEKASNLKSIYENYLCCKFPVKRFTMLFKMGSFGKHEMALMRTAMIERICQDDVRDELYRELQEDFELSEGSQDFKTLFNKDFHHDWSHDAFMTKKVIIFYYAYASLKKAELSIKKY